MPTSATDFGRTLKILRRFAKALTLTHHPAAIKRNSEPATGPCLLFGFNSSIIISRYLKRIFRYVKAWIRWPVELLAWIAQGVLLAPNHKPTLSRTWAANLTVRI